MTGNDLSTKLKARLHPKPYTDEIIPLDGFDFLLYRKNSMPGSRYAVAFRQLTKEITFEQFLEIRSQAQKLTKSMWLFREVGIHIIFCGPEIYWKDQIKNITADTTGVHSIIVQAIHFIDPDTKSCHLNRSTWGPVKFGVGGLVSNIVEEEINKEPQSVE